MPRKPDRPLTSGARCRTAAYLSLLALVALTAAPGALASHLPRGGGAANDFTHGEAWQSLPAGGMEYFTYKAWLTPLGVAKGYEFVNGDLDGDGPSPPFSWEGPVTCLTIVGNRASFFYEFERADPAFFQGGGVQVYAEDNGRPRNGRPVDGTAFDAPIPGPGPGLPPLEGPTVCPPPRTTGYDTIESGNLVVHDAVP